MSKRRLTSLSVSLAMVLSLFTGFTSVQAQAYSDVGEGHWAYEWVEYMNEHGYIHGYPDGAYRPGQNITRAEYVTILNYIFESTGTTNKNYIDVLEGDWYYGQVHAAVDAGYLSGYDDATDEHDGTMKPNNFITREEAAVVAARAYDMALNNDVSKFSDADDISFWAVPYVGALLGDAVLLGDTDTNAYRPKDFMLRAEVASMLAHAEIKKANGELTQNERVNFPPSLDTADGAYTIKNITTSHIAPEKQIALSLTTEEDGKVGPYKITAAIDGVIFADNVTLEGLQNILNDKTFTPEELEKLSISFVGLNPPDTGAALNITIKATDAATGEQDLGSKKYKITFGGSDELLRNITAISVLPPLVL